MTVLTLSVLENSLSPFAPLLGWQHPDEAVRLEAVQVLGQRLPATKALSQLSECCVGCVARSSQT